MKNQFKLDKLRKLNYSIDKNKSRCDSTLNLPKTKFSLRSSLNDHEFMESVADTFYREIDSRQACPKYTLIDGPPFANGNLHVGHALNKLLKDTILRHKALQGHQISFKPAWDCHGLPIELKALNKSRHSTTSQLDPLHIRMLCRKFALEAIEKQRASMHKWGIIADFANPLLTMDPQFEANQLQVLAAMTEKGLIYSAKKPVFFSPSAQTALAEAELEYTDSHVSLASYVSFKAHLSEFLASKLPDREKRVRFVAWTTTPWTLPSNKALAVGKDIVYSLVYQASQNEYLIMARERVFDICTDMQHTLDISIPEFCLGSDLVGCHYESLSFDESSVPLLRPVLLANFVTSSSGSGLVHVAPDYGTEDFELCRSFGIAPNETDIMDDSGNFTSAAPKFLVGMNILSGGASECILEVLKCSGSVLSSNYHTHRYPYDWRTGKPVIQRATRQWFASISSILPELLASLENVQFIPDSGKDKMAAMLRGRSDWCISRQRHWGVPIPALFDGDNELSLDPQVIRHVAELVRKDPSGSDIWWKLPIADLIPSSRRDHLLYRKSFDTLDVWFDSGTVWSNFPDKVADLYLEGSDQYRGWFQSSLITSVATTGKAPFKTVLSHGFVLDQQGLKMSKSVGNVVDPDAIVNEQGSDVLRLWAASTNYTQDVNIGPDVLKQVIENKRKLRNTLRFCLANLYGYSNGKKAKTFTQLDHLMLERLQSYRKTCGEHFEAFNFAEIVQQTVRLCSQDLSAFYFDILKDRLYTEPIDSPSRQGAQAVLSVALQQILLVMKPITPFLVQEILEAAIKDNIAFDSDYCDIQKSSNDVSLLGKIQESRSKFLEWFGSTGKRDLQAKSTFQLDLQVKSGIFPHVSCEELRQILMVARVEIVESESDSFIVGVKLSDRLKCPRCWTFNSTKLDELCFICQGQIFQDEQQCSNKVGI